MRVEELVEKMKVKVMGTLGRKRGYKKNQKESYSKMDKTASIKVDIQSRKAQRLIQKTLAAADRPGKPSHSLPPT
ncbi:uncharacterized protein LOC110032308 [Phalaenopsis equestris]|uniref:uncharacterized protein LOC110032308 n=1 Tax=Phalaenopsis equestris TaxID=78828 RepID=UPI0009E3DD9D|nr:uncharacterized protein LOC110032308 [Phalaenopsis equestris]